MYVGPSWAARSFDTPNGQETEYTNLARELSLDVIDLSKLGSCNSYMTQRIQDYQKPIDGIIWIYCEPILDLRRDRDLDDFLQDENCWQTRQKVNADTLDSISSLGIPVALIGGHSDIEDCNHKNITLVHASWQKFLANIAKVDEIQGWGADIAHREIIQRNVKRPAAALVDRIVDTMAVWNRMELYGVFCYCHPTRKGTELFAKEISSTIKFWINNL